MTVALTAAIVIVVGVLGLLAGLSALTIVIGQVPKLVGVEKASGNFFEQA